MKTVLCYGDSNTYGYIPSLGIRYADGIRWPGRLKMLLGQDYAVIEEGCSGRTTVYDDPIAGWKNGRDYLKPCIHSHRPIDIVILALGSNDLKANFHASAADIAAGAETLVDIIQTFSLEDQGFSPRVVLVSPPEIGEGITSSEFYGAFLEDAVERSREFPHYYKEVAERKGCIFFNAAAYVKVSEEDSLHFDPEAHRIMAEKLYQVVRQIGAEEQHGI